MKAEKTWYPMKRDGKTVMRKIVVRDGKKFIRLKMLPVQNVRRIARLFGAKPTPTKSKRVWVWMEV